jgi:hypothetical protein
MDFSWFLPNFSKTDGIEGGRFLVSANFLNTGPSSVLRGWTGENSFSVEKSRADRLDPQIHDTKMSKSYAAICFLPTDEWQIGRQLAEKRTSCTGGTRKTRSLPASEEKIRMAQQDGKNSYSIEN